MSKGKDAKEDIHEAKEEAKMFKSLQDLLDSVREGMPPDSVANWENRAREMQENPRAAFLFLLHHISMLNHNIQLMDMAITNLAAIIGVTGTQQGSPEAQH